MACNYNNICSYDYSVLCISMRKNNTVEPDPIGLHWIGGLTMQVVPNVKGTAGSVHNRDRGGCFIQVATSTGATVLWSW